MSHLFWLEKQTYQRLLTAYPVFRTDKRLRTLFVYLTYCRLNGEGYRSLSSATLTRIYTGKADATRRHDFSITTELGRLQDAMPGLQIVTSAYRIKGSQATDVIEFSPPQEAIDILVGGRQLDRTGHLKSLGLVDARTGLPVDAAQINAYRAARLAEADATNAACPRQETRVFLDFMNHAVTPDMLKPKADDVLACDRYLEAAQQCGHLSTDQALATWRNLDEILMLRHTVYTWSPHSKRIFSMGYGHPTLHSPIRQRLFPDLIEVDLAAAQAATLCVICDVPLLRAFLESGQSLWKYLLGELGFDPDDSEMKAVLKIVFYSLCFGKATRHLFRFEKNDYRAHTNAIRRLKRVREQFLAIPLIAEVLQARDVKLREIHAAGGAHDCDGDWIPLGKRNDGHRVTSRSVLSQLAQAIEWRLLEPLRHEAMRVQDNAHGWRLLIWSHDGFSFRPRQWRDADDICTRLVKLVDAQARLMNVPTRLEFKMLGRKTPPEGRPSCGDPSLVL